MNYFESELEKYYLIDMAGMALWSDENWRTGFFTQISRTDRSTWWVCNRKYKVIADTFITKAK
jgi:hypothetical protein